MCYSVFKNNILFKDNTIISNDEHSDIFDKVDEITTFEGYKVYDNPL